MPTTIKTEAVRVALALQILLFASGTSYAGEQGMMIGGGFGSVDCIRFDAEVTKAQTAGGMNTVEGAHIINGFSMYVLGFQTGYNLAHPTINDVFKKEGGARTDVDKILFWIDDWCRKNPEKRFANGLIAYIKDVPR